MMKVSGCFGLMKRSRLGLLAVAVLVSLTLCRDDNTLQITVARERGSLPDGFFLYQLLEDRGIRVKSITPAKDSMIIHLDTPEQAQAAQLVLQSHLPEGYAILKSRRYSAWQWLYRPAADEERLG
ncbi:EnvZ/OmpR regulon moderator [Candidatus Sodalis pierantonius str. SOPE]|uniref:Modulator protein MzrA n=2 Tax=Sodalis TaxID=84565 RepID=W0HMB6_9GAMM|nr:EnvZ/OmpR regulon moderator [Candidatus Sodalis pierantonius str. SOPE]